jgi:hypothetical protein
VSSAVHLRHVILLPFLKIFLYRNDLFLHMLQLLPVGLKYLAHISNVTWNLSL